MSFTRIRLILISFFFSVGCYFLYAFIFVPNLLIPPLSIQHTGNRHQIKTGPAETIDRLSRYNAQLLTPLFPDPEDWRRKKPGVLMTGDQSGLFLFEGKPNPTDDNRVLSLTSCTIVIPSTDEALSIEERYRRAIVVETKDRLVIRFRRSLDLNSSFDFGPDVLEEGKLYGEVTIWSNMASKSLDDDIRLSTRDVTFNAEQVTTDSEVIFHYGRQQVEGTGLRVYLDIASKGRPKDKKASDNPFAEFIDNGNIANGFSIKEVRLAKLSRLEFEMPDYLPELPSVTPSSLPFGQHDDKTSAVGGQENGADGTDVGGEKMVKVDVRCQDEVYFAPNSADDPSAWGARFTGNVEITANHQEREQDSLQCDTLYFYLIDPIMKQKWDQIGSTFKGKRKPSGNLTRLKPYQVRALGSGAKEARLALGNEFLQAAGDEIVCEIDAKRVTLQSRGDNAASVPVSDNQSISDDQAVSHRQTTPASPLSAGSGRPVTMSYGQATVTSDKIDFTFDPERFGRLIAYKKGSIRNHFVDNEGKESVMSVDWNDGVRIVPTEEDPNLHVASFRGDVRFGWDAFGEIRAEETDFWFTAEKKKKEDTAMKGPAEEPTGIKEGANVIPQSAQFRRQIHMTTPRGECRIQDEVNVRFANGAPAESSVTDSSRSSDGPTEKENTLFGRSGSIMGGEGKSTFLMTGGRLNLWAVLHQGGTPEISGITIQDNIRFVETSLDDPSRNLRIEGNDVRIENPNTDRVAVVLRGRPANFTGQGLNLTGYDIRVNRAENTFSVIGSGRLRFTPQTAGGPDGGNRSGGIPTAPPLTQTPKKAMSAVNVSESASLLKGNPEPVEVWWPRGMTFDGKSLIFQGNTGSDGTAQGANSSQIDDKELVLVRQGTSLELKSPLISLILKNRIEIFDFDMGENSTSPKEMELEKSVCQGTSTSPVEISWFGTFPVQDSAGKASDLKGRFAGEVAYMTLTGGSGDFTASGPGWFRGTVETPPELSLMTEGEGNAPGTDPGSLTSLPPKKPKPWTHFHLIFNEHLAGNIDRQDVKVTGDVRSVLGTFDRSEAALDVNDRKTFSEDTFFLTCDELGVAQTAEGQAAAAQDSSRFFELTAFGDTRFDYQTYTGRGEILKYNDMKKTVILQGNGITPASISRQDRPGAPVNTQSFNSVMFNLKSKKIDSNISSTGMSGN